MFAELTGVIMHGNLCPKMIWDDKLRDGEMKRVPFIHFHMLVEDKTKPPVLHKESGKMRRPRDIWQVILPENERGQKLFENLSPGRQVLVKGRGTSNPNYGTNRLGEQQLYKNNMCRMNEIQFLDSKPEIIFARVVSMLQNDLKVINSEQHTDFQKAYETWTEEQIKLNGPPRIVIDNTVKGEAKGETPSSDDPDNPDFQG